MGAKKTGENILKEKNGRLMRGKKKFSKVIREPELILKIRSPSVLTQKKRF